MSSWFSGMSDYKVWKHYLDLPSKFCLVSHAYNKQTNNQDGSMIHCTWCVAFIAQLGALDLFKSCIPSLKVLSL